MRCLAALLLFAVATGVAATASPAGQDAKQPDPKKTQPKGKFDPPKATKPDEATMKQISEKTELLRKAVEALKAKKIADDVLIEVEIYLKAAENIVRFEEWYAAASGKWALTTLDEGLARAKLADGGKAVWRDAPGKWVNRAYRSQVDGSIQPYAVLLPADFGKDPKKKWRLDIVLHGRDGSLTEAKFIATHGGTAPKDLGYIQLEVYGRGNNAYRWAGEADVFEAQGAFQRSTPGIDPQRVVLRGFSMGGAGTWHLGLHHPSRFCVIGPGAGFTNTHGYIASLPKELPDYQEKCLRIYDAVDYAENAFNVPVVAYSGEKDAQKKAADNIENALKGFKEPHHFTHLVAPGLEHQMPKPWQDKAEAEYRKYADKGRDTRPKRVRFVTYTPRYDGCDWIGVLALDKMYEKAVIDATREDSQIVVKTSNVRVIWLKVDGGKKTTVVIDDQKVEMKPHEDDYTDGLEKVGVKWQQIDPITYQKRMAERPEKWKGLAGPIDDAFTTELYVLGPIGDGWHTASLKQFTSLWDRYFRGTLHLTTPEQYNKRPRVANYSTAHSLILFGDPEGNPLIAKVLPKLPITWTKEKLVVNGVEYDPKTHVPVLIYPNPLDDNGNYVVINSGHTFKEADLKGTNALLYPRLGDWAVLKPTPTAKDPAAFEVVAAGLFDENWQFPKK
ncbi:MAG: hypothetical protein C0467_10015 [Planctomycetaceae bacterium]|nr:hypothetical protein [Planctomycetaceae bacterium]